MVKLSINTAFLWSFNSRPHCKIKQRILLITPLIGLLANRFRLFHTLICCSAGTAAKVVQAAVVLHNLLRISELADTPESTARTLPQFGNSSFDMPEYWVPLVPQEVNSVEESVR